MNHLGANPAVPIAFERLKTVSVEVRDAFRSMLGYEPGMRPAEVCRRFEVNKDIGSRLVACCELEDPLELAYRFLSPAVLRRVVRAAREQGLPTAAQADQAVDEFEKVVRAEFGDQSKMNVLIGSMHPDLRAEAEAAQKQSAFRGMSQLHGLFAEVSIQVCALIRNPDPSVFDRTVAEGCLGLRRLRPGPPVVLGSWQIDSTSGKQVAAPGVEIVTADWGAVVGIPQAPGGSTWVQPRAVVTGALAQACIDAEVLGSKSSVSFGTIQRFRGQPCGPAGPEASPWCGVGQLVAVPSKLLVFDLLVEEGLFGGVEPRLVIYDTAMRGVSRLFDPTREFDRLDLCEQVDTLSSGPFGHRSTDVPFIPELLTTMLDVSQVAGRRFKGYRLRQSYPVYGSQVAFAFPRG